LIGFASRVTAFAGSFTSAERLPLTYFLTAFPGLVLGVFAWPVSKPSGRVLAPSDFDAEVAVQVVSRVIAITGLLLTFGWVVSNPGWEPWAAFVGAIGAYIAVECKLPDRVLGRHHRGPDPSVKPESSPVARETIALRGIRGYLPVSTLVPEGATQVALVGQNLSSRLGRHDHEYEAFRSDIAKLIVRIDRLYLVMMTPRALFAIHPRAFSDMSTITLKRLTQLATDLGVGNDKVHVCLHPSATLSMLAIDWDNPGSRLAYVTPKFQRTDEVLGRISVQFAADVFDAAPLDRMLEDAGLSNNGACQAKLIDAASILEELVDEVNAERHECGLTSS
jgi:hypothetical protein